MPEATSHSIAVVVPVYRGEKSLHRLVDELLAQAGPARTPHGRPYEITEIILVDDNGPDRSDQVIRELEDEVPIVRSVWLSRNFGQHAATMAGMAVSTADWIVTLDEDGQHNPADIPRMLDVALDERSPLVYAQPVNQAPHAAWRNATSHVAKFVANNFLVSSPLGYYGSYRLVIGEIGRSLAAYTGPGSYLDAALSWLVPRTAVCPVELREETDRPSGYHLRSLASHFWRLVLTSGTRPLRVVSMIGVVFALFGVGFSAYAIYEKLAGHIQNAGWTSVIVVTLLGFGVLLISLGVIAEYVGVSSRVAMGRPAYLIVSDPAAGPLGRTDPAPEAAPDLTLRRAPQP